MEISDRTVERLSVYRRLLTKLVSDGWLRVYSHDLASFEGLTAAQVRRDVMTIGFSGSPAKGYDAAKLLEKIDSLLTAPGGQGLALVGVGHLGKALLAYFNGQRSHLSITAAFDTDEDVVGRVVHGCRCHSVEDLGKVLKEQNILLAIVAVPGEKAQAVSESLVAAGVRGLVNFAPVKLRTPENVYVEDIYITVSLEKVAFFAQRIAEQEKQS